MSSWELSSPEPDQPRVRRVREEVRDSVAAGLSTLAASIALTVAFTLLIKLAG